MQGGGQEVESPHLHWLANGLPVWPGEWLSGTESENITFYGISPLDALKLVMCQLFLSLVNLNRVDKIPFCPGKLKICRKVSRKLATATPGGSGQWLTQLLDCTLKIE